MITLPPNIEQRIIGMVDGNRYRDPAEVVSSAMELLEERDRARRDRLENLKAEIAIGLAQLDRGEVFDAEEVFDEIERQFDADDAGAS